MKFSCLWFYDCILCFHKLGWNMHVPSYTVWRIGTHSVWQYANQINSKKCFLENKLNPVQNSVFLHIKCMNLYLLQIKLNLIAYFVILFYGWLPFLCLLIYLFQNYAKLGISALIYAVSFTIKLFLYKPGIEN